MIVVDVETTGINPKKSAIASIGAVEFANPLNQFYVECLVPEWAEITNEALAINGFTREQLRDQSKPSLKSSMDSFIRWTRIVKERTLAGENPTFDRDFLNCTAKRYGFPKLGRRVVDLHGISYASHKLNNIPILQDEQGVSLLSLDETLRYCGMEEEKKPHHALTGARLEAEALSRIIFGRGLLEEYKTFEIPPYLARK